MSLMIFVTRGSDKSAGSVVASGAAEVEPSLATSRGGRFVIASSVRRRYARITCSETIVTNPAIPIA
jgi:hypothetical protein